MNVEQHTVTRHWNERAHSYNFNSEKYFSSRKINNRWQKILNDVIDSSHSHNVLDAGCGPAILTRFLLSLGHHVTAIDISSEMLNFAKKYIGDNNDKVVFNQCSATDLPYEDNTFDMVFSRYVIWTLPNPIDAFQEWKRVVKPGGIIGVIDGNWYYHYYRSNIARSLSKLNNYYYKIRSGFDPGQKLANQYAQSLPCTNVLRPHWDIGVLDTLGFKNITTYENLEKKIKTSFPFFRNINPSNHQFLVTAQKPKK